VTIGVVDTIANYHNAAFLSPLSLPSGKSHLRKKKLFPGQHKNINAKKGRDASPRGTPTTEVTPSTSVADS
jgi:hypothetical protein